ncbi:Beta-lactamase-like [Macleaya cordata]|uniref:Beta-lactamase-like n=1 Tax=Macleaya cordata TaxID=56857 RepID=A0A200Q3C8_MACCD|nr:Beta-lactamase-like [Macleaya cordata]
MATLKLAVIINNCSNDDEYLLVRQTPPPKFGDEEYDSYVDSDLWDLPSAKLNPLETEFQSGFFIEGAESCSPKLSLTNFDVESTLHQVLSQVGFRGGQIGGNWVLRKYEEEAEFGPGTPVNTVFIFGKLGIEYENLQEVSRWMSIQSCLNLLLEVKPSSDRIGHLAVVGLLNEHMQSGRCKVPPSLCYQEYPPGVTIVPMGSKTQKPFRTTNLVVIAPSNVTDGCGGSSYDVYGDALIMDPGCRSEGHSELMEIVASLPRKLVVFVTHHHYDHVEGLSIIQKCNPDATLLAHENTMRRIGKDDWSLGYTAISGAEEICIGGQRLTAIFAPGHTDGHMALLHVSSHSLIVGDHCHFYSSNNWSNTIMFVVPVQEYFETSYKFLELSPHALIPMHGRVNLWPKNMLCGYIKNRRNRESSILKAIEGGAETLFDIVSKIYSDVDPSFWIPASSNVRIHVEHLAQQDKLPKGFSLERFNCSRAAFADRLRSTQM